MEKRKKIPREPLAGRFLRMKVCIGILLFLYLICCSRSVHAQSSREFVVEAREDGTLQCYRTEQDGQKTIVKNVVFAIDVKKQGYSITSPKASGSRIYRFDSRGVGKPDTSQGFVNITYNGSVYRLYVKRGSVYTGWYQKGSKKYYCVKGQRIKGWRRIKNRSYYFNSQYVLQKNKIVGTKASGYYYVDKTGVRVTAPAVKKAVAFVMANCRKSQTPRQKLRTCFEALCRYPYRAYLTSIPSPGRIPSYAEYMFTNHTGNCYCYAISMAYIARVLGFESRLAAGGVTAYAGRQLSPHGWCEIKIGSSWKMCDCSMQNSHKDHNLYLVARERYPFRLRCDKTFSLIAKNGKIQWK